MTSIVMSVAATTDALRGWSSNERGLTEERAGTACGDDVAVAAHLGIAGDHEEELASRFALPDQLPTRGDVHGRHQRVDRRELLRRQVLEQRNPRQTIGTGSMLHVAPCRSCAAEPTYPAGPDRTRRRLLVAHRGGELVLGIDQVVVIIETELDLGPRNGSGENTRCAW